MIYRMYIVKKLYELRGKYEGDPAKRALIDSLISQLVAARTGWAFCMALESLREGASAIPELKDLGF